MLNRGHEAELVVAKQLKKQGYKIIATNWKTRHCEIDVIASKKGIYYFVEVKHRTNARQGSGLEYITPEKLKNMQKSAQIYISNNPVVTSYELAAVEVGGENLDTGKLILIA